MAAEVLAHHTPVARSWSAPPVPHPQTPSTRSHPCHARIGIDLHANGATPKNLTDAAVQASDLVITMGCGDE